ncbi:sulfate adenylyltransferase subunit 2 [Weeksella virosa]|uniref:Phosphoadenosine phosphosulfate reductase n=2 Tax=Weeksella virosa TaxID=1014 RepID=F0NXS4_WEEVC|nr:phosphoadenosine phosphosulfate reductase family protein [Weeksella virosa]ADX66981.1 phosphoadenosine phosphosulfate reductase [Weeksella virosa DSM 16922]VEH63290.1 sulfate adenylyltransferase subunit 2 [Weeksella virosa]
MLTPLEHAKKVISTVRDRSNRAILFYSAGKDSIVLLDLMSKQFDEVVCVFMYFVKDLEHINKYIRFSKAKYKNVQFIEVPHWILTKVYSTGFYCSPQKVRQLKLRDVIESMKLRTGIPYAFIGEKQSDNMNRRIKLRQYELEAISHTNNVYPLSHWKDGDVRTYIEKNQLPTPINYGKKKNKSVGMYFDTDVYLWLRDNYPDDLKKVLKQFPLSEKLLFDHDTKSN